MGNLWWGTNRYKAKKKAYRCFWCGETIPIGEYYVAIPQLLIIKKKRHRGNRKLHDILVKEKCFLEYIEHKTIEDNKKIAAFVPKGRKPLDLNEDDKHHRRRLIQYFTRDIRNLLKCERGTKEAALIIRRAFDRYDKIMKYDEKYRTTKVDKIFSRLPVGLLSEISSPSRTVESRRKSINEWIEETLNAE